MGTYGVIRLVCDPYQVGKVKDHSITTFRNTEGSKLFLGNILFAVRLSCRFSTKIEKKCNWPTIHHYT